MVSRGYGGNYSKKVLEVLTASNPMECGDEPLLIKQKTHAVVAVSKKESKRLSILVNNIN